MLAIKSRVLATTLATAVALTAGGCHWQLAASAAADTGGQAARGTQLFLKAL